MKLTRQQIVKRLKPVDPKSHKGTLGHALIIGGSHGKIGSVCLSSKAALRTGCGLVTVFLPECGYPVVQSYIPEVMAITDANDRHISRIEFELDPDAIAVGPGMGVKLISQKALHEFLKRNKLPLVIDADALNILSKNKSWLKLIPRRAVLTPHPKEFERLAGKSKDAAHRLVLAKEFSAKFDCIIVLKGSPTLIVDGETTYENTTGNAALATAGSGDVLTGMIVSLIAQSYSPIDAAIVAVYVHGTTADIALPETGTHAFIASDIIKRIGKAFVGLK